MSSEPTNPDREAEKTTRETVPASAAQQSRASEWDEASESSKSSESPHQFAQAVSASMSANMRRTANGDVDVLHAIGGWRGLVESSLPAVAFLVLFTVTKELNLSLIAALVAAAAFTLIRLVQGSKLVSALTGLVGVAICAFAAYRTGNASDYFVVGFWTNGLYSLGYLVSMAVRWPITGLIFGVIRGEGLTWRKNPVRVRQYMLATWIITILMLLVPGGADAPVLCQRGGGAGRHPPDYGPAAVRFGRVAGLARFGPRRGEPGRGRRGSRCRRS